PPTPATAMAMDRRMTPIAGSSSSTPSACSCRSARRREREAGVAPVTHTSDPIVYDGARAAGVLLHPTSLPGSYGVGDLGDELTAFLDWAVTAGMRIWQTLPLNPPGYGNSPYGCLSSFAGNPLLISPQRLLQDSLLPSHAADDVPQFADDHVEFDRV